MRTEVIWQSWREVGLLPHQVLIWKKSRSVLTYSHFMWDYEPMMYGWREGQHAEGRSRRPTHERSGRSRARSRMRRGSIHPTMKPVETIRRPIAYHTKPGGLIYEPFCGSGTALIAAEELGRTCYAHRAEPAVRRRRRGPLGGVHGQAGARRSEPMGSAAASSQIRTRVADIYGLVVDGVPHAQIFRFVAANCSWKASERTIDSYIARAREQMIEEAQGRARARSSPSRWRVSSGSSRARAPANQLKTALAVQNSIDRMFGDFAGERDELSDVDRFLEELLKPRGE